MNDRIPRGVRRLFRLPTSAQRRAREMDDEVRFHLEMRAGDLIAQGMSPNDVDAAALAQFGDPAELHVSAEHARRRQWIRAVLEWSRELSQDVRFGIRQLRRAPRFAVAAILMSALGIGANTAIFSIVHHLILAPSMLPNGDRTVMLATTANGGMLVEAPAQSMIDRWRVGSRRVEHVVIYDEQSVIVGDTTADVLERGDAVATLPGAMSFVRARPALGRDLTGDDTVAGAPAVVLIGYARWQAQYGGRSTVLGTSVSLAGVPHTIIGVLPPGFRLPFTGTSDAGIDFIRALQHSSDDPRVSAIALRRPGVSVDDVNRELSALIPLDTISTTPAGSRRMRGDAAMVLTLGDSVSSGYKQIVMILFGAVGLILLIACANVANLLLVRAWSRQRELAVRLALGAGRARLARQMLAESLTLALLGGAAGVGVASITLRAIVAAQPPHSAELSGARLEPAVLLWSFAISLATGLLFGAAPAVYAAGAGVANSLKSSSGTAPGGRGAQRLRGGLVVAEVALSVVLLASAGLLIRSLAALSRFDMGFEPRDLSGIVVSLPKVRYQDLTHRQATLSALIERVRSVPGVSGAAYAMALPPGNVLGTDHLAVEGVPMEDTDTIKAYALQGATPEYFRVAGIAVRRGRVFAPNTALTDRVQGTEVMVSESFANAYWPGGDAVGKRVRSGNGPWATIVGVVSDVQPPGSSWGDRRMEIYEPLPAAMAAPMLIVRSALPAATLSADIRKSVRDIDPSFKLRKPVVPAGEVSNYTSLHRFMLTVLGSFAALALVLAAVGLYGVISFSVSQRTREVGIRVALGAQPGDVIEMVLRQAMQLSAIGIALGTGVALAATRSLGAFLYGVGPGDPLTLAAVALVLGGVAVGAAYAPARRAASIDPLDALRAE